MLFQLSRVFIIIQENLKNDLLLAQKMLTSVEGMNDLNAYSVAKGLPG